MMVSLQEVFIPCLNLCMDAGAAIRSIIENKDGLDLVVKEDETPQTIADRKAEQIIVQGLKGLWPQLIIVGEEGGLSHTRNLLESCQQIHDISKTFPTFHEDPFLNTLVDISRITVFVDPLDGTKAFVSGKFEFVTTLIGICIDDAPVAGVINYVFSQQTLVGWHSEINPNLNRVFQINWDADTMNRITRNELSGLSVTSSSRFGDIVQAASNQLKQLGHISETVYASGSGYKFGMVIRGEVDSYLFPITGTCQWDTCPGTALLRSLGGDVRNRFGGDIKYTNTSENKYVNSDGFIACVEKELCNTICFDVTRSLEYTKRTFDDSQLSTFDLTGIISKHYNTVVDSFKTTYFPDHQQHCAGVALRMNCIKNDNSKFPLEIFFKRIVSTDLPARSVAKWRIAIASYLCEANFFALIAPALKPEILPVVFQVETNHAIPMSPDGLLSSELSAVESLLPRVRFGFFLENLSEQYIQKEFLDLADIVSCSKVLNAFNQPQSSFKDMHSIWSSGSYWARDKRLTSELESISTKWARFMEYMKNDMLFLPEYISIGDILHTNYDAVAKELEDLPSKVLIHGDLKTANIYFSKQNNSVKLIDFQWSGWGGSTCDIVYLLLSSASCTVLQSIWETPENIVDWKSNLGMLIRECCLKMNHSHPSECNRLCALSVVNYARVVIAYQWANATPEYFASGISNLGKCTHNKSYEHCHQFLRIVKSSISYLGLNSLGIKHESK